MESEAMYDWSGTATYTLQSRMRTLGWGYAELAQALEPLGIRRSPTVVGRRINRGVFSAGFFLACLSAMQVEVVYKPTKPKAEEPVPKE